jgi:hypothetical protein
MNARSVVFEQSYKVWPERVTCEIIFGSTEIANRCINAFHCASRIKFALMQKLYRVFDLAQGKLNVELRVTVGVRPDQTSTSLNHFKRVYGMSTTATQYAGVVIIVNSPLLRPSNHIFNLYHLSDISIYVKILQDMLARLTRITFIKDFCWELGVARSTW